MTAVPNRARRVPRFHGRTDVIVTVALCTLLAFFAYSFVQWAIVRAVWSLPAGAGSLPCRAVKGEGACWAVVVARARFMLFGSYPLTEQWRPQVACLLFASLYAASLVRAWWTRWLLGFWVAVPALAVLLLRGGWPGLVDVPTELWGGLPLTFLLSTAGFTAALPFAVLLALGRRSALPAISALATAYIEVVRGVPVITFLFMAAVMFPLFAPEGFSVDKLLRAQVAYVMVTAAYVAEVIRGGLQAVPRGQYEAAGSLGLSFWPATILVVLPQALRASVPALVNTFIALFKDTSLVIVIGLFDLLGTAKAVLVDATWVGFGVEVYLFAASVYFVFCYVVSRFSLRLERELQRAASPA
jgi:general L-amino acid transport system permease protein